MLIISYHGSKNNLSINHDIVKTRLVVQLKTGFTNKQKTYPTYVMLPTDLGLFYTFFPNTLIGPKLAMFASAHSNNKCN